MKKFLALGLILIFAASVAIPSAMAFGDCEGKAHKTKVADSKKSDKDKS